MPRPKQPRCRLCKSNRPLPFGEEVCKVCRRVCPGCGRRVPYCGRGQPAARCPDCREWSGKLCPCGRRVPRGRRLFCSTLCRMEWRRIKCGKKPRDGWRIGMTVESAEGDHAKAAAVVAAWMRLARGIEVHARGDSVWLGGSRKFVVRHVPSLAFEGGGRGLPPLLPVDDIPRFEALHPWPARGYLLLDGQMSAAAHVPVDAEHYPFLERHRRWVPRYGEWADFFMAPRRIASAFSLVVGEVDLWSLV